MNIAISWSSGGYVSSPFMGVQLRHTAWCHGYRVSVDITYHKNDYARVAHEDWFSGVTHVLGEADWQTLEAVVEKERRAEILGLR